MREMRTQDSVKNYMSAKAAHLSLQCTHCSHARLATEIARKKNSVLVPIANPSCLPYREMRQRDSFAA